MFLSPFGKVKSAAISTLQGATLPIALDFGAGSLKVLQLQSGDPPQLVAAATLATPDALIDDSAKRFAFQFQALPKLLKTAGFKGKRAVVSLPAAQMFCKHLQLPKADNLPVAELVENAVPVILGCPGHALVYRHVVVEGAQPTGHSSGQIGLDQDGKGAGGGLKQEVICLAAARDMVGRMLQACKDAKLELVGMQPEYFCTLKAFEHLTRRSDDAELPTLYLDIAMGTTKVLIAHGNKLVFAKTIQLGGLDLDKAVAHASDCNLSMAHQRRLEVIARERVPSRSAMVGAGVGAPSSGARSSRGGDNQSGGVAVAEDRRGGGPGRSMGAGIGGEISMQGGDGALIGDVDLSDTLEVLEDEIAMCLRYYEAIFPGRRVAQAVFLGGESLHRGLCQHVARRIRTTALSADPMARVARTGKEPCVNVDFGLAQPGWAVALGLSLLPTDL